MGRLLPGGLYPRRPAPALHPSSHRAAQRGKHASTLLVPGSMSSKLERASGWRSSDFGVKIISWRGEEEAEQGSQPRQKHLPCKQRSEDQPAPPACPPLPKHGSSCKKFVPCSAAMLCQMGHRFPTAPAFPVWISPGEWAEVLPGTCLPHGWNSRQAAGPGYLPMPASPNVSDLPAEHRKGLQPPQPA